MMDIDAEDPPDLVEVPDDNDIALDASSFAPPAAEMQDLAVSKVPLTIITGTNTMEDVTKTHTQ